MMKEIKWVIMMMAVILAGGMVSCDKDKDEPEQDSGKEKIGFLNLYDFNGYYLSEFRSDNSRYFEVSYAPMDVNGVEGSLICLYSFIEMQEGIGYDTFSSGLQIALNTATNKMTSLVGSYSKLKEGSGFEINKSGNLSSIVYHINGSLKSFKFTYDDSERLVGIEMEYNQTFDNYTDLSSYRNAYILKETYTLTWEGDNITEINKARHRLYYREGALYAEYTSDEQYVITYGEEKNPARQYMYSLSSIFINDPTMNICPMIGMIGEGPENLPLNITHTENDSKQETYDIGFLTGDVNGKNGILQERIKNKNYKYSYGPYKIFKGL